MIDLPAQYRALKEEIDAALERVCEKATFTLAPEVDEFERAWADYCEAGHCVGVSNGTAALHLALLAAGVGEGDEVITTPMSFFATAETICLVGATPVFADIEPGTYNIDPGRIEELISERTRAIMPVHLFGHPAEMDAILAVARERGLAVIEDAAQAHGALYRGRKVGALGDLGAFSFYPTKNLSACGEGGAVVTDDAGAAERVRSLRAHGEHGKYAHSRVGFNYRMAGVQGAVLKVKLAYLDRWNARRRQVAERYAEGLASTPLTLPREADHAQSAWHLYVVRCERRDALREHLAAAEVWSGIHYPVPINELEAMREVEFRRGPLPEAERMAREALSLPIYAEISDAQVDHVIGSVRDFF
ncbi:MAG: DegT/DnrJ/EryC1/StrS family aminotransferase [Planctomycetota bacterium]